MYPAGRLGDLGMVVKHAMKTCDEITDGDLKLDLMCVNVVACCCCFMWSGLTAALRFLGDKFPAVKRFGIEGAEAVLPGLHALVTRGAELGVEGVELGMAHRGRLNVSHDNGEM
eukprot:768101-Hanusia_phi.AAC.4